MKRENSSVIIQDHLQIHHRDSWGRKDRGDDKYPAALIYLLDFLSHLFREPTWSVIECGRAAQGSARGWLRAPGQQGPCLAFGHGPVNFNCDGFDFR